ncbi:hypothetical protein ACL02U_01290 [Streptomyces sp. MS06]|uniref:hypothetical protein n=1 Tax=Streptomyces sp. MS06 TaxID=3385974 RepID=UPI00399EF24F
MLRHPGGHARRRPRPGGTGNRSVRLLALAGTVACAVALPLAVASAGPPDAGRRQVPPTGLAPASPSAHPVRDAAYRGGAAEADSGVRRTDPSPAGTPAPDGPPSPAGAPPSTGTPPSTGPDGDAPAHSAGSPLLLGLGLTTAARCGPELASPEGVEAQTCVLASADDTWARTYYRNATGRALDAVLSLMGPDGHTVRMHCALTAEDDPGTCETPRRPTRGEMDAYTAVVEFADAGGRGPLLLRSGSNPSAPGGG